MNSVNNELECITLQSLHHRVLFKLFMFIYKIKNYNDSPKLLKNKLILNLELDRGYFLRNDFLIASANISSSNNYGERTFEYFFPIFINNLCIFNLSLPFNTFKLSYFNNINLYFNKFITLFPKFDTKYVLFELL